MRYKEYMTADEIRLHLRYTGWASRKALEAVQALPPEEQTKPRGVSHESIARTLLHIYMADRIWYKRVVEPELEMPDWNMNFPLAKLARDWSELQQRWEAWAESLQDSGADRIVTYTMRDGSPGRTPASQLVLHVVNHGTLHRGQVVGMLRQLGIAPPNTDLFYYLRELAAAAKA